MQKLSELSIFFPFWNEEKNIESVVTKASLIADTVADRWEIIIIDDGSDDKTAEIASNFVKKDRRFTLVSHIPNRGYGAALKEGFSHAKYKYIVFSDGDGQFDFSEVRNFLEKIKDNDFVIGFRGDRKDNRMRHILMNLLKIWDFALFGFYFKDIDCGFKMFRKEAIDKIMPLRSEGAMISTEFLAKAVRKKFKIAEVEVTHYPRIYGDQSGANVFVVMRAILESLLLWLDIQNGRF